MRLPGTPRCTAPCPVPAWPAAAASPRPPRRGPAGPARAAPSGPARSPPDAAWHPRQPSARPPAPSPAFAGRWLPVRPRGGLAPAHAPGRRVGRTRVSPAPLDHRGGGRPGPEPSARLEGRGALIDEGEAARWHVHPSSFLTAVTYTRHGRLSCSLCTREQVCLRGESAHIL